MKTRWLAVMTAANLAGENIKPNLEKLAQHSTWYMRSAAVKAMHEVDPRAAYVMAKKLVSDKALVVRSAAVDVLGNSTSQEDRNVLWLELSKNYNFHGQSSLWVRSQIAEVLANSANKSELGDFARLLNDGDQKVMRHAIKGLENITGKTMEAKRSDSPELVRQWQEYLKKVSL